jgi:hypothetical protein
MKAIRLRANAGYCWFHSQRCVTVKGKTIFGSVAGRTTPSEKAGDIQLTIFDHSLKTAQTTTLANIGGADDHNAPAFALLADEKIILSYQGHHHDGRIHYLYTSLPLQSAKSLDAKHIDVGVNVTYSNVFVIPETNEVFNFHRSKRFNPNYLYASAPEETFTYGGLVTQWDKPIRSHRATGIDGGRPYVIYSQRQDEIHFALVEDHPRAYGNSVYHGYIKQKIVHNSFGEPLGPLPVADESPSYSIDALTKVFSGDENNIAWVSDIFTGENGEVSIAFSVRKSGDDLRYHYARLTPAGWKCFEVAFAGNCLYPGEEDYSGLISINPSNHRQIAISTNCCLKERSCVAREKPNTKSISARSI